MIMECPLGTSGANCATRHEKVCPEGGCQQVVSEAPTSICAEGFIKTTGPESAQEKDADNAKGFRNQKKGSNSGGRSGNNQTKPTCTKTEFTEFANTCPHGTEQISPVSCASYFDLVAETKTRKVAPLVRCPEGYSDNGEKHCSLTTQFPATPTCSNGSQMEGTRCALLVPKNQACPKGAIEERGSCWVARTADPLMVATVVEEI